MGSFSSTAVPSLDTLEFHWKRLESVHCKAGCWEKTKSSSLSPSATVARNLCTLRMIFFYHTAIPGGKTISPVHSTVVLHYYLANILIFYEEVVEESKSCFYCYKTRQRIKNRRNCNRKQKLHKTFVYIFWVFLKSTCSITVYIICEIILTFQWFSLVINWRSDT